MTAATALWIAHAATAALFVILLWAGCKIWEEAADSPQFLATLYLFRREHVLPTLGCFAVFIVTLGFVLVTLPH